MMLNPTLTGKFYGELRNKTYETNTQLVRCDECLQPIQTRQTIHKCPAGQVLCHSCNSTVVTCNSGNRECEHVTATLIIKPISQQPLQQQPEEVIEQEEEPL